MAWKSSKPEQSRVEVLTPAEAMFVDGYGEATKTVYEFWLP